MYHKKPEIFPTASYSSFLQGNYTQPTQFRNIINFSIFRIRKLDTTRKLIIFSCIQLSCNIKKQCQSNSSTFSLRPTWKKTGKGNGEKRFHIGTTFPRKKATPRLLFGRGISFVFSCQSVFPRSPRRCRRRNYMHWIRRSVSCRVASVSRCHRARVIALVNLAGDLAVLLGLPYPRLALFSPFATAIAIPTISSELYTAGIEPY